MKLTSREHRKLALDLDVVPGTLYNRGIDPKHTAEENRKAAVEYLEDLEQLAGKATKQAQALRDALNEASEVQNEQ